MARISLSLLPALVLLLWSTWSGTFWGSSDPVAFGVGLLVLTAFLAYGASRTSDPLALGPRGRWLIAALAVCVLISLAMSPVPRAGWVGVALGLALLRFPSAVAACWPTSTDRDRGLTGLSLAVAGVALYALFAMLLGYSERPAEPLGHHNLLGVWLVTVLPVAALPWRRGGWHRGVAALALVAGLTALVLTRSLGAAAALALVGLPFLWRALRTPWRWLASLGLLLPLALGFDRLTQVLAGQDLSTRARWGYWEAGWRGFLERPFFGWGPGSTPWTLGFHLRPEPGVHPPGEAVADLHSLAMSLLYELGLIGTLLMAGLLLLFLHRRREGAQDSALVRAAGAGLLAGLLAGILSGWPFAVGGLAIAWITVAGVALASGPPMEPGKVSLWVLLPLVLLPTVLGNLAYGEAREADKPQDALAQLKRAQRLDPAFPLYSARHAWLRADEAPRPAAEAARRAAEAAPGVSLLWLKAGALGQQAGLDWSAEALLEACRTDPLQATAPFLLATGEPRSEESIGWTVRALLAEPLLLASPRWAERHGQLGDAINRLWKVEQVDSGWRTAVAETFEYLGEPTGPTRDLGIALDNDPATSLSLYTFHRRPWPDHPLRLPLVESALPSIDLVPATLLDSTDPGLFTASRCGLPE